MKILHMTPPDVNNGVYKYIFNHMKYMDLDKFQFSFWTKGKKELMETVEYKKYGFDIFEIKNVERGDKDAFRRDIEEVLSKGFDVVHLHTSSWRGFFIEQVAMEMGIKRVIVHSHSTGIDVADSEERETRIRQHNDFKEKFSFDYATDIWACSNLAAKWLYGENIPKDRIVIMPNAIQVSDYVYDENIRKSMRDKYNLHGKVVIGNVGRYTYQKNHMFLLKCFAKACREKDNLFLLCLGEGDELDNLIAEASKLNIDDKVLFLDWQENASDYLQAMDGFFLPSRFEGLPISLIEAQAASLKCFVSNVVTEEVKITDLLEFLSLEEDVWVKAMINLKDYYRRDMTEEIVAAGYSIEDAARRLMKMYEGSNGNVVEKTI